MVAPLRRWHSIGNFRDRQPTPRTFPCHCFSEQTMNDIVKKLRGQPVPDASGIVE
jgi:hypothetical protein